MKRKIVSLTITSIITLLCACEVNEVVTETYVQSDHTNPTEIPSQELSNSQSLADGLYFAIENNYSNDGWKHIVNFEVVNGKIEIITLNCIKKQITS